ncbi:MAG: hypothetical protein AAGC93_09245 [Cyanobacteria bacterium P01_F01_bin.53]
MTFTLPPAIADCLIGIATHARSPAYLQINAEGQLMSWEGSVLTYGLKGLHAGDYIGDRLCFLDGLFPLSQPHEVLPNLQIEQGLVIDVHLLLSPALAEPTDTTMASATGWIVLLDVSVDSEYPKALQQQVNELSLLKYQYAKLLNRSFSQPHFNQAFNQATDAQPLTSWAPEPQNNVDNLVVNQDSKALHQGTVHQDISVVLIELFGPREKKTLDNPLREVNSQVGDDPASATEGTFLSLKATLSKIAQTVVEEGGVINHVLGKTVVAFFGLVPTKTAPARQALSAAKRLIAGSLPGTLLGPLGESPSSLGIAVTTGAASTGFIELNGHQVLNAIGPHIQNILGLKPFLKPNIILVDPITLQGLDTLKDDYQTQVLNTHDNSPDRYLSAPELYELTFALD